MSGQDIEKVDSEEIDPNQMSFEDLPALPQDEDDGQLELTPVSDSPVPVEYQLEELEFASPALAGVEGPPPLSMNEAVVQQIENIPSKMAFKIGEVAEMLGVKQYVLRYWESEFEALRPKKSKNNQRIFTRKDVETAMLIRKLLYEDRFSIEGARAALKQLKQQVKVEKDLKGIGQTQARAVEQLYEMAEDIQRLKAFLL